MLKNGRPYHLPQLNLPYEIVLGKLDDENISYEVIQLDPNENDGIEASQKIVYSDEISGVNLDESKPIWIADNKICDGHHRYFKAMFDNKPVIAIKLDMGFMDACRVLNKIQDIYEFEQSQGLEEVVSQEAINYYQGDENQFLNSLEEDNVALQTETPTKNEKTIVGYRESPIKENSVIGNFFTLKPVEGFDKYEIEFDNLMDTNSLGVTYKDGQEPVDILAKSWFPNINFEKLSSEHNTTPINLKTKAIAEKAKKMGYDGIKYGNTIIQGLK
ncbi:MAG: hypothetical protein PF487_04965 [Bacteroidales bacterium]|jgi:hypothetical protein|nr:hypothetical protein [Bacteroidales bacterium]